MAKKKSATGGADESNDEELRTDGPTLEEYVKAGYDAKTYPPQGYAVRVADAGEATLDTNLSDAAPTPVIQPTISASLAPYADSFKRAGNHVAHVALDEVQVTIAALKQRTAHASKHTKGEVQELLDKLHSIL